MRRPIVVGNWKMNGTARGSRELLQEIVAGFGSDCNTEVGVCVPFVFIPDVAKQLAGTRVRWGSQNVSDQDQGAYTGEISAAMLTEYFCRYAIVGHSERRLLYKESSSLVAARFNQAVSHGIQPILCVGETDEQRDNKNTFAIIESQLLPVLNTAGIDSFADAVIAYEPVWAIGTGKTATTDQAQEVHAYIREIVASRNRTVATNLRIIYGGSVNPENASALFSMADIDGGLVGGASLDGQSFLAIIQSASLSR